MRKRDEGVCRREEIERQIAEGRESAAVLERAIADVIEADRETRIELAKEVEARHDKERDYYFEIAKQITTLDTAALVVFLAVGRQVSIAPFPAVYFIVSLVFAFLSMVHTGTRGTSTKNISWGNFHMTVAATGFL